MQSTAVNGDAVGEAEIYQSPDGSVRLDVRTDGDTVWLTRQQIGDLFSRDVKTIGKHVANARREELADESVVAKFATTAADGKIYKVEHYNLDMVLSIGYRVKSPEGIQFRRWANDVLKRYVLAGVATNEARLREIGAVVRMLERSDNAEVAGIAEILNRYSTALELLDEYDHGNLKTPNGTEPAVQLDYEVARAVVDEVGQKFPKDVMFGALSATTRSAASSERWSSLRRSGPARERSRESSSPALLRREGPPVLRREQAQRRRFVHLLPQHQ